MPKEFLPIQPLHTEKSAIPNFQEEIMALGDELPRFTRNVIKGMSREDEFFTNERRRGMLTVLEQVPFQELDPEDLKNQYVKSVKWITEESQPRGSVADLLQAGIILSPHFEKNGTTYRQITKVWKDAINKVKQKPEWQSVGVRYLDLEEAIKPEDGSRIRSYSSKELLMLYNTGNATSTIAGRLDLSVVTINKGINRLKDLGLLKKIQS